MLKAMARGLVLTAALVLVITAGAAAAAERHVAVGGNDGNPGSQAQPWASLQHAVDQARPGDVIYVHQGYYVGCRITRSGRPEAWISLKAAPGEKVVIDRPGPANRHRSNLEIETWDGERRVAYWVIEGFEVADAPWAGIDIRGQSDSFNHHLTIKDNQVHHSGRTGIFVAFSNQLLIEGNQSHHNGEHGIYLSNSSDQATIRDNQCHSNYACGIHLNGDASMGADGLISGVLVTGNTIYGNGRGGGAAINLDGVVESVVSGNTIFDNLAGGIALFRINGAEATRDVRLENNLVRMPKGSRWAVNITNSTCRNITLRNNTLFHADPRKGAVRIPGLGLTGFQSDYNQVCDRFSIDGGRSVVSLKTWQSYGLDQHSTLISAADLK